MPITLSYDTNENTPLVLILEDVARYAGIVEITANETAASYEVVSVDSTEVTVKAYSDTLTAAVTTTIALNDITALHLY